MYVSVGDLVMVTLRPAKAHAGSGQPRLVSGAGRGQLYISRALDFVEEARHDGDGARGRTASVRGELQGRVCEKMWCLRGGGGGGREGPQLGRGEARLTASSSQIPL